MRQDDDPYGSPTSGAPGAPASPVPGDAGVPGSGDARDASVPGDLGVPGSLARVLADVAAERAAQDARWGVRDIPDGTDTGHAAVADAAKRDTDAAGQDGSLTWRHILEEEFHEALAETDPAALRTELVQTAAVAVKWVQAIDRRDGGRAHRTPAGAGGEKLVRDRIPQIIRAAGREARVRSAGDGEYRTFLGAKLYEEAGEYIASGDAAELADVLEVVYALAAMAGVSPGDLERARAAKAARTGRFERRWILRTPEA